MARPRKPTAILKLQGDCTPSRHGYRGGEPQPKGRPVMPDGMPDAANWYWNQYVTRLIDLGIAKDIDTPALEDMCRWWARIKELETQDPDYRNLTLLAMCSKQLKDYLGKFGQTPSDRAKLSVGEAPNELAREFLA